jgi:hypothetical protein
MVVACIVVKAYPVVDTDPFLAASSAIVAWAYQVVVASLAVLVTAASLVTRVVVACGRTELEEDLLLTSHLGPQSLPPSFHEPLHAFQ